MTVQAAPAVKCSGLTKDYGGGHGLFDLDLEVRQGESFGLIGPNGAGKTTMLRLLMDLIRPTRGKVEVFGLDAHTDSLEVKRSVGYLTGELPQFPGMTADYIVTLLAGLRGGVPRDRILELAQRLELDLDRRYDDLSHGNKQKVGILQAFMHSPRLLVLDEPTLGLDPIMQREFRTLVAEAVTGGASVLLSSHVLSEVEQVCSRMGLIHEGRLRKVGTLQELRAVRTHLVTAVLGRQLVELPTSVPNVVNASGVNGLLTCEVHGSVDGLVKWLSRHEVVELDVTEMSLEEVFLHEVAT
jgi:ABC-2 type transport system ATP-binding protein